MDRVQQYVRDLEAYEEEKKTNPEAKEPDKAWLKGDYENALKLIKHEKIAAASASRAQDLIDLARLADASHDYCGDLALHPGDADFDLGVDLEFSRKF